MYSNRDGGLDGGMGIIFNQLKILKVEVSNFFLVSMNEHSWFGARRAGELQFGLFPMIGIKVQIPKGVNEFVGLQVAYFCNHHREEGIGGDVEGNAQKKIGTALVELAT